MKIRDFCFVSKLDKQKGASLCRMARVFKPTKFGLKIIFIIGWIDSLGSILWTPRLSEWSRLASLSRRPELPWCHFSSDLRNSASFERPSHRSSILPIFLCLQQSGPWKLGKCEVRNYNSAELLSQLSYEAYFLLVRSRFFISIECQVWHRQHSDLLPVNAMMR